MSLLHGTVTAFDREVGLGEVRADDGTSFVFHCIEIADGSRDIAVGGRVVFGVIAKLGGFEAAGLAPE